MIPSNQSLLYETGMEKKSVFPLILLGLASAIGLVVVIYFAIQPQTLPKIKPSGFKNEAEVAASIHQRLQLEIQQKRIFFVGISDIEPYQGKIVFDFLKQLHALQGIKQVIFDSDLATAIETKEEWQKLNVPTVSFHFPDQAQYFFSVVMSSVNAINQSNQGSLVIVLPTLQTTRRYPQSVLSVLFPDPEKDDSISLLFANFFLATDQKNDLLSTSIPCHTSEKDQAGTGDLGCLIMNLSRIKERKLLKYNSLSGFMDQISSKEYLFILKQ